MLVAAVLLPLGTAAPAVALGPEDQPEVVGVTAAELQAAMTAGETTSLSLVQEHQRRTARHDGDAAGGVNAFVDLSPYAQADARARDVERAAGQVRGPLHGVPVAVKANMDTADLPVTAGAAALAGTRAPDDADAVAALREAGAVVLGTTNLHELARGITTVSSLDGQTRNPFDQALVPAGSSGGSAAAVASGFAAVALGTDTCGSVRFPAAVTSLVGFRPSQGATSTDGVVPLSPSSDVVGVLARSVGDAATTADVLARRPGRFTGRLGGTPLSGARIGLWVPHLDSAEPRVRAQTDATVTELRSLGATVVRVDDAQVTAEAAAAGVITWEFAAALDAYLAQPGHRFPGRLAGLAAPAGALTLDDLVADGRLHPTVAPAVGRSAATDRSDPAYAARLQNRRDLQQALDALFAREGLDALLHPTLRAGAARVGQAQDGSDTCRLSAYSGRPAVSVPNGFAGEPGSGQSPLGMELLGTAGRDAELLALAAHYESAYRYTRPAPLYAMAPSPACDGSEPGRFDDTDRSVHAAAVDCLAAAGIARGRGDGSFDPATPITRAAFASLLSRTVLSAQGVLPDDPPDAFADDDGSVHEGALDALAAAGVVAGTAPGVAAPDATLTRGQAASLVARAWALVYAVAPRARTSSFGDDDGSVHEPALDGLAALDVVRGTGGGRAAPGRDVTRGQMASLLARAFLSPS